MNGTTSHRRIFRRATIAGVVTFTLVLSALAPGAAWAGKLTCLTGTDPSVANDAQQLANARTFIIAFGSFDCPCLSPGRTNAAWQRCLKNANLLVSPRPQCKGTLAKQLKNAICGYAANDAPCVKKSLASGKVTCAIKPSAQCVDTPGKFTQVSCASMPDCVDAADTNGDGLVGSGDSGACAAPVCGNGVREFTEECDPPGTTCAGGGVCTKSCICPAPTNTPTRTPVPGQPTNTPTRTRVPGAPTSTPTPTSNICAGTGPACGASCCPVNYTCTTQGHCCPAGFPLECGSVCCPTGMLCIGNGQCAFPTSPPGATNTPHPPGATNTPVPGQPTNTPVPTAPASATATQTPSSIGCCMNATVVNVTGCLDSSANGFNAVFCGQSQGVWINNDHCSCQSSGGPCSGSCVPGTPAPRATATRTPTGTLTPAHGAPTNTPAPTPNPAVGCCANPSVQGECVDSSTVGVNQGNCDLPSVGGTWVPDQHCSCGAEITCMGSCVPGTPGPRFRDNGDGTISDTRTGLMWEKKDQAAGGIHYFGNLYEWSAHFGTAADGTIYTSFLATLNTPPCFAGHCDWRLPTTAGDPATPTGQAAELETLVRAPCRQSYPNPCLPRAFNTNCTPGCTVTECSCTSDEYWSASSVPPDPRFAFAYNYDLNNYVTNYYKSQPLWARAVR